MPANPKLANGVASPIGIHASSTVQYHRVGTRAELGDRSFRYYRLSNSTGVVTNNLCQAAVPIAGHTSETSPLTIPFVPSAVSGGIPAGSKGFAVETIATTITAGQYEEGYLKIQAGTGLGQIYKIKGHGTGTIVSFELYDPVLTTIATGATFTLVPNPWADIIITPVTTRTGMAVGVPSHAIPAASVAAPTYGWIQTWGPCSVLGDTTNHAVATGVFASVVVGSSGIAVENDVIDRIGVSMETLATDTVYQTVYLQIAP